MMHAHGNTSISRNQIRLLFRSLLDFGSQQVVCGAVQNRQGEADVVEHIHLSNVRPSLDLAEQRGQCRRREVLHTYTFYGVGDQFAALLACASVECVV